jgi:predicted Rossmann-fold nucleotide-binding protein
MQELTTPPAFVQWCQDHAAEAAAAKRLDLRPLEPLILARPDFTGALFLGCDLTERAQHHISARGGLLFPQLRDLPFDPYHPALYTPRELFDGFDPEDPASFAQTFDQRVFHHFNASGGPHPTHPAESLARSLHDHAMTEAQHELLQTQRALGKRVMAIMGGHNIKRADPHYRRVAHIARRLTLDGFLVTTGGGPGAMEAGHLGASFASHTDRDLDHAIDLLAVRTPRHIHPLHPHAEYKDADWMARAWHVWTRFAPSDADAARYPSLGIPTWLYGHEPPTLFATYHAKYFANSIREEGLLSVAVDGILYTPGKAGTVQEVFQDACQNYYGSMTWFSPMIFMDTRYWTETLPVKPLLEALMAGKKQAQLIAFEDDDAKIIELFQGYVRANWRA